jgi:hypothetical protein
MVIMRSKVGALLLLLAVGFSATACVGSGGPSASGNVVATSPSAAAAPTATGQPLATATPRPSPAATPTPGAPVTITIDDPDLIMTLPVGWASYPMETYRFIIDAVVKTASPEEQAVLAVHLKDIDAGRVRIASGGQIGGANGTLIIQVDTGDSSLEAAVARFGLLQKSFTDPSTTEERSVILAIGDAVRRVQVHPVPSGSTTAGVPSKTVEYIARLDDGRTLWILATGPAAATTFEALIDASVATLKPH